MLPSYRYAPLIGGDSVRHKEGAGTEPEYGRQDDDDEIRGISR